MDLFHKNRLAPSGAFQNLSPVFYDLLGVISPSDAHIQTVERRVAESSMTGKNRMEKAWLVNQRRKLEKGSAVFFCKNHAE